MQFFFNILLYSIDCMLYLVSSRGDPLRESNNKPKQLEIKDHFIKNIPICRYF